MDVISKALVEAAARARRTANVFMAMIAGWSSMIGPNLINDGVVARSAGVHSRRRKCALLPRKDSQLLFLSSGTGTAPE